MPASNLKEDARLAIIIECLNPGSLFKKSDCGKLTYQGLNGKSSKDVYGKKLRHQYVIDNYVNLRNFICESIEDDSTKNLVKKINKSYMISGLRYYMIGDIPSNDLDSAEPLKSISRYTQSKIETHIVNNIECAYCKNYIKYGATICSGCGALIEYKSEYHNKGMGRFVFFLSWIIMTIIAFPIAAFMHVADILPVIFITMMIALLLAIFTKIKNPSSNYGQSYSFKRPSRKSIAVGFISD